MTRRVGLDHPTPPAPVRGRTLIAVACAIISVFLLIVTCTTVDTAKAAPTMGGTVYYVDVIHCATAAGDSAVSHRYSRLGDAVGSYTRSVTWQVQHTSVTGQVRMRYGRDGSAVTHLIRRHLKACHR